MSHNEHSDAREGLAVQEVIGETLQVAPSDVSFPEMEASEILQSLLNPGEKVRMKCVAQSTSNHFIVVSGRILDLTRHLWMKFDPHCPDISVRWSP